MDPCFSLMYMESNLQKNLGFYNTLWKINVEHNKQGLEDDFPFKRGDF